MGFQCPHCSFVGMDKQSVKKHVVQEHRLKPYFCPSCQEGFTNFKDLNKHITASHKGQSRLSSPYEMVELAKAKVQESGTEATPEPAAFRLLLPPLPKMAVYPLKKTDILPEIIRRSAQMPTLGLYPLKADRMTNYHRRKVETIPEPRKAFEEEKVEHYWTDEISVTFNNLMTLIKRRIFP